MARPWSKVAADLCELDGCTLLVTADYYSNFIEVVYLNPVTSRSVIKEMKDADVLVTDNGVQFASAEFAVFAETWCFEPHMSSPHYPQSNGKAENAVQMVKCLFAKCKASGQSEYLALLDWWSTPTEVLKQVQHNAFSVTVARHSTKGETRAIMGMKCRQQPSYDKHTKPP